MSLRGFLSRGFSRHPPPAPIKPGFFRPLPLLGVVPNGSFGIIHGFSTTTPTGSRGVLGSLHGFSTATPSEPREEPTKLERQLNELENQLKELENQLKELDDQITTVSGKVERCKEESKGFLYWSKEKEQLRNKEEQLRNKEEQLRARLWKMQDAVSILEDDSSAPPGDSYGSLWRALLGDQVSITDLDAGMQLVTLPSGMRWITEDSAKLFVRKCTRELGDNVMNALREHGGWGGMVVTGNPGIGKSWFASYLLWASSKLGDRAIVFESVGEAGVWVFQQDGRTRFVDVNDRKSIPELDLSSTLYLFDPAGKAGAREPLACRAFTVVTSSPDPDHYKQTLKRVEVKKFYPPWQFEEALAVLPYTGVPWGEQELRRRFERFGGISRMLFGKFIHNLEAQQDAAIDKCPLATVVQSVGCSDSAPEVSHKLLQYDSVAPFDSVTTRFASPYVLRKILERDISASKHDILSFIHDLAGIPAAATLRGSLFEQWAIERFSQGGQFRVRRLRDMQDFILEIPRPVSRFSFTDASETLSEVTEGTKLMCPVVRNYPVVDAFLSGASLLNGPDSSPGLSSVVGLQVTVSLTHPIILSALRDHMKTFGVQSFDIFFVLPSLEFRGFKAQPLTTKAGELSKHSKEGITQWALELDLSAPGQ